MNWVENDKALALNSARIDCPSKDQRVRLDWHTNRLRETFHIQMTKHVTKESMYNRKVLKIYHGSDVGQFIFLLYLSHE